MIWAYRPLRRRANHIYDALPADRNSGSQERTATMVSVPDHIGRVAEKVDFSRRQEKLRRAALAGGWMGGHQMGFWHTGYMEFHEPTGQGSFTPTASLPPAYPCPTCGLEFSSERDSRVHAFEGAQFRGRFSSCGAVSAAVVGSRSRRRHPRLIGSLETPNRLLLIEAWPPWIRLSPSWRHNGAGSLPSR